MVSEKIVFPILFIIGLLILVGVAAALLIPGVQPPLASPAGQELKPNVRITLYAGELPDGRLGFGLTPDNITSPGPTLRFRVGDVVEIRLVNVGRIPHAFAITAERRGDAPVLFNAAIGSASRPIQPGGSGRVVFKVSSPGEFYYVCPVPGHVELGMWGRVIVSLGG